MILVIVMGAILVLLGYFLGLSFFDNAVFGLVIALIIWVVMSLLAYYQGDSLLLTISGARKINRDDHPRLYNIVEEMKIASGMEKMPDIYIIDDPALNAFATGRDKNHASVAITSGLLQKLNRDELQGVIGHEMAHIKNRDVLLMAMTSVLLGTIVILAWYGSRFLIFGGMGGSRGRHSSGGGGQAQIIIIVVALVFMILAPILAQIIYLAISRKREYLADASSALYTRYPEGLASALEKLGASTGQLKSANQATAPMYIVNPFRKKGLKFSDLSSTHPPISERIRILRGMAGAAYNNYDESYRQVHRGGRGIIPGLSLVGTPVPLAETPPSLKVEEPSEIQRARETSSALRRVNNFTSITCECGAVLKIPPGFKGDNVTCPRCHRRHAVSRGF